VHLTIRFSLATALAVAAIAGLSGPASASPVDASACGTPLGSGDIANIAALSDMNTLEPGTDLQKLEEVVERNHQISQILISHKDRRGVFIVGFDTAEQVAVMPIQRDESQFVNPVYARRLSLIFLRDFLKNVHGEFTGGPVEYGRATSISQRIARRTACS
jgi:hypothetical protein